MNTSNIIWALRCRLMAQYPHLSPSQIEMKVQSALALMKPPVKKTAK